MKKREGQAQPIRYGPQTLADFLHTLLDPSPRVSVSVDLG